MRFYFSFKYLFLTLIFLAVEIFIALFVNDDFVRPFVGDVLVVILIYCFLRIFLDFRYWKIAFGVLILAFTIEILQYFDYVKMLGLENNRILSAALGRTFAVEDFAAYFAGFLLIISTNFFYERCQTD